jgi:hypothetical protein
LAALRAEAGRAVAPRADAARRFAAWGAERPELRDTAGAV